MEKNKKRFLLRKKRIPTYTVTVIKNACTPDFIEVIAGFSDDLLYRSGIDLNFKPSMWIIDLHDDFQYRYFVDGNGIKHYMKDFEKVGNGDPYATVDLILIEASAFGVRDNVDKLAKQYMLTGIPTEESYQVAYEYWTEW